MGCKPKPTNQRNKECKGIDRTIVGQPFPTTGKLYKNMNLTHNQLIERIEGHQEDTIYTYVVKTVEKNDAGGFIQRGTGPNFQGGLITLCTCKHQMRAGKPCSKANDFESRIKSWKGVWIAGWSNIASGKDKRNALVYLMKVNESFHSHAELWAWLVESKGEEVALKKAAHKNIWGDVFKSKNRLTGEKKFDPNAYYPPCGEHVHKKHCRMAWKCDIDSKWYGDHRPALLVGDPQYSYLWNKPVIIYKHEKHPRTKKSAEGIINYLKSVTKCP